ncbi:MAG: hypothetical protein LBD96_08685 [Treponema sp.]|jgi:hypothetical protein|nr:hypothetical protein [Treponema sp.]
MSTRNQTKGSQTYDWHAAFRDGIQLTFFRSRHFLSYDFELPLNSQPLRIDALIIKKPPHVLIDNPLGAMFRTYNIIEYKSPGDYLSIADYHKAGAYTRLYSVVYHLEITDMTITLIGKRHPRKLLKYLEEVCGYKVYEKEPGIYEVVGDIVGIQVVETGRLGEGGVWLKDLRRGLKGEELEEIIRRVEGMPEGSPVSAYLYQIIQANSEGTKELAAMSERKFEKVLEECGLTAKWEAKGLEQGLEQGLERGLEQGLERVVKKLWKHGMASEEISLALELSPDTVSRYLGV